MVRHRFLVPVYAGSIPAAPASESGSFMDLFHWLTVLECGIIMSESKRKPSEFVELLSHDWGRLSSAVKYLFLSSLFVLLTIWIVDRQHSLISSVDSALIAVAIVFALAFVLPLIIWLYSISRILFFRKRYPVAKMGLDYKFIIESGAVCVVSEREGVFRRKHIRWIDNPRTLYDLGFSPYWKSFMHHKSLIQLANAGYIIKRGLRTNGRPGPLKKDQ